MMSSSVLLHLTCFIFGFIRGLISALSCNRLYTALLWWQYASTCSNQSALCQPHNNRLLALMQIGPCCHPKIPLHFLSINVVCFWALVERKYFKFTLVTTGAYVFTNCKFSIFFYRYLGTVQICSFRNCSTRFPDILLTTPITYKAINQVLRLTSHYCISN